MVLKAGTEALVETPGEKLGVRRLDRDTQATVFAMSDEWHIYDVDGVLHFIPAEKDR